MKINLPKKLTKQQLVFTLGGLVIIVVGVGLYFNMHSKKPAPAVSQTATATKPSTSKGSGGTSTPSAASPSSSLSSTPSSDQPSLNGSLTTPNGQLGVAQGNRYDQKTGAYIVSKATPGLNATCSTVSGASCVVVAKGPNNESLTVSPDSSSPGIFTFDWSAKDYADGTWTIQIVATKNNQSVSANLGTLEVQG